MRLFVRARVGGLLASAWMDGALAALGAAALVADVLFAYTVSAGTYDGDGLLNVCWPVGMAIIAGVAWRTRHSPPAVLSDTSGTTVGLLLIPFGFAAAAVGLLGYGNVAGLDPSSTWLASAASSSS